MGFFKKLFRRKGKEAENTVAETRGRGRKQTKQQPAPSGKTPTSASGSRPKHELRDDSPTLPVADETDQQIQTGFAARRGPDLSDGTQRPTPRLVMAAGGTTTSSRTSSAPVDLDQSISRSSSKSLMNSGEEKKVDGEDIEQDDKRFVSTEFTSPKESAVASKNEQSAAPKAVFTMPPESEPKLRFSAGNVSVENSDASDGGESSSFNLSTDAEDTEYEAMRRRLGGAPRQKANSIDANSTMVTNYTTDGETSVFPGLPSEDEATMSSVSQQQSILNLPAVNPATGASLLPHDKEEPYNLMPPPPSKKSQHENTPSFQSENAFSTGSFKSSNQDHFPSPTKEDRFASSNNIPAKKEPSFASKGGQFQSMEKQDSSDKLAHARQRTGPLRTSSGGLSPIAFNKKDSPNRTKQPVSKKIMSHYNSNFLEAVYGSPDNETKQAQTRVFNMKKQDSEPLFETFPNSFGKEDSHAKQAFGSPQRNITHDSKINDDFADFADFSNFPGEDPFRSTASPEPAKQHVVIERDIKPSVSSQRHIGSSSSANSAANNETSLSELLAQAKSKSARNRKTSSSVNSAPAMSAAFLRQHHNLRGGNSGRVEGTSVSDIINSLEATNASRGGSSSRSVGGGTSRHVRTLSRGDDALSSHSRETSRSTKERLRRRRERRHARENCSSDSEDDHEDSESWLFDEVTGALGPVGITADLESLSGRSNRSNSSRGNRSHKSHRSHRSHKSRSRRRHTSRSGDSVDSRHSRDSRRSRSSKYSHRSARSYISQMSEQSRSVANDLLRLEMQLAMVGSGGAGDASSSVGGNRSVGGRVSRPSTSGSVSGRRSAASRRSRVTVTAPPGKLGIILANKADSKGTVVSGVRTSSPLADKITPGDRIVAIDGEDVSLMTVSEITTIMARKSEYDRTLTILTTPRITDSSTSTVGSPRSDRESSSNSYRYRN